MHFPAVVSFYTLHHPPNRILSYSLHLVFLLAPHFLSLTLKIIDFYVFVSLEVINQLLIDLIFNFLSLIHFLQIVISLLCFIILILFQFYRQFNCFKYSIYFKWNVFSAP